MLTEYLKRLQASARNALQDDTITDEHGEPLILLGKTSFSVVAKKVVDKEKAVC